MVLWTQSATKDYIRAEHKLHSISKLFISRVIFTTSHGFLSLFIFRGHSTREPASSRVTYFILRAYTGTSISHSQHRKKLPFRETFTKRYVVERTSKAEIRPEEQSEKAESCRENLLDEIQLKGPQDRNRHKNRIKRSGQAGLVYVKNIDRNIPTTHE